VTARSPRDARGDRRRLRSAASAFDLSDPVTTADAQNDHGHRSERLLFLIRLLAFIALLLSALAAAASAGPCDRLPEDCRRGSMPPPAAPRASS
jgi:hypothetical protein